MSKTEEKPEWMRSWIARARKEDLIDAVCVQQDANEPPKQASGRLQGMYRLILRVIDNEKQKKAGRSEGVTCEAGRVYEVLITYDDVNSMIYGFKTTGIFTFERAGEYPRLVSLE